jgi:hypothetical protein
VSQSTLQPHICGRCESAIAPFRSVCDGSQCGCPKPSSPSPVTDDALCFFAKDVVPDERSEPVSLAPALDKVELMRLASGTTAVELIGERVEEARRELLEAMKLADRHGESDFHRRLAEQISDVDDLRAIFAERSTR